MEHNEELLAAAGIGRGTIIRPETSTIRAGSVAQRLRPHITEGSNALGKLVRALGSSGHVTFEGSKTSLVARMGDKTFSIPVIDKYGRMFRNHSVFSTVGSIQVGSQKPITMSQYVYGGAAEIVAQTGKNSSPQARFAAARSFIEGLFATTSVYKEGKLDYKLAGSAARMFEPHIQVGRPLVSQALRFQDRRTFFLKEGDVGFKEIQHYQTLARQMSMPEASSQALAGGNYRLKKGIAYETRSRNLRNARLEVLKVLGGAKSERITRPDGSIKSIHYPGLNPEYTFLTGSQSGNWAFGSNTSEELLIPGIGNLQGKGENATFAVTMSKRKPSDSLLFPSATKLSIHQLQQTEYIQSSRRAIIQTPGQIRDLKTANKLVGNLKGYTSRTGSFGVPLDLLAFADPQISKLLLGKSGGILDTQATKSFARPHEYIRTIKIAKSGMDTPGMELFDAALSGNLYRSIESDVQRNQLVERGGLYDFRYRDIRYRDIGTGHKGVLGANLDAEGNYVSTVKARKASDRVIGSRYRKNEGDLQLVLAGNAEDRVAQQILVGGGTRVGAHRRMDLKYVNEKGMVQRAGLLADVPMLATGGKINLDAANLVDLSGNGISAPGEIAGRQLHAISHRIKSRFGTKGLGVLAESMGGRLTSRSTMIEFDSQKGWAEIVSNLQRNIGKNQDIFGPDTDRIFTELTQLRRVKLTKEVMEQLAKGVAPEHSEEYKRLVNSRSRDVFVQEQVPVGLRERTWRAKSGKHSVRFKRDDLRLLTDSLSGYTSSPKDSAKFSQYAQMVEGVLNKANPHVYKDLKNMTRALIEAPHGIKTTQIKNLGSFGRLPADISNMDSITFKQAKGTILEVVDGEFLHKQGFYTEFDSPLSILGDDTHRAATKESNLAYIPGPKAAQFSIDHDSGAIRLQGGARSTAGGQSVKRAYLELFNQAQDTVGGSAGLAGSSVKGRLDAIWGGIFNSSLGKGGSIRQTHIAPEFAKRGYQGYMPNLGADTIGMHKIAIKRMLGDKGYQAFKSNQDNYYMWARRQPTKSSSQFRVQRLIELSDKDIALGNVGSSNLNAEEMIYSSKVFQYLSAGDSDGDQIEAFLLGDKSSALSQEQKAMGRLYGQQQRQGEAIDDMLIRMGTESDMQKISSVQYGAQMNTLADDLRSVPGSARLTTEMISNSYEQATRHVSLTPASEVYFRVRQPMATTISDLAAKNATEQEVMAYLSKYTKNKNAGRVMENLVNIMRRDPSGKLASGKDLVTSFNHLRNLVNYTSLHKATNKGNLNSEVGFQFLDDLRRAGAGIASAGDNAIAQLTHQNSPVVENLAEKLYTMFSGDEFINDGKLPKSSQTFMHDDKVLDLIGSGNKESMMNYARRHARSAIALEAAYISSEYSHPSGALFRTANVGGKTASIGGTGVEAAMVLNEADTATTEQLQTLISDMESRATDGAVGRNTAANAVEIAAREGVARATSVRGAQAARFGINAAQNIAQSRFFKPAAIALGALVGWESIKSVAAGLSGDPPAVMSAMSSAPVPPSPMMQQPKDSTFDQNFLPEHNVARVQRTSGQKVNINVRGKADSPVDFRNLSSTIVGNYGFQPVQGGTFRDSRSGDLNRRETEQYIRSRMNARF